MENEETKNNLEVKEENKEIFKEKNKKRIFLWIFLIILTLGILVNSYFSYYSFNQTNNGEWLCFKDKCTEYYTQEEWFNDNCFLNNSVSLCNVNYNGQNIILPKDQITIPADSLCKVKQCYAETFVRIKS